MASAAIFFDDVSNCFESVLMLRGDEQVVDDVRRRRPYLESFVVRQTREVFISLSVPQTVCSMELFDEGASTIFFFW